MKQRPPGIALIWMYKGKDAETRRAQIESFEYPDFEIIEAGEDMPWSKAVRAVSEQAEVCVFWVDDEKPVRLLYPSTVSNFRYPL